MEDGRGVAGPSPSSVVDLPSSLTRRAALGSLAAGLFAAGCEGGGREVVVYCATDRLHAEPLLRDFERRTGIAVRAKFDTEATKSLSLVNGLIREADAPRCDLFWNNELLGTADLAARGLLVPHRGEGWAATPGRYREAGGLWTAFGGAVAGLDREHRPGSGRDAGAVGGRPLLRPPVELPVRLRQPPLRHHADALCPAAPGVRGRGRRCSATSTLPGRRRRSGATGSGRGTRHSSPAGRRSRRGTPRCGTLSRRATYPAGGRTRTTPTSPSKPASRCGRCRFTSTGNLFASPTPSRW